jgi:hypothetical protein
MLFKEQKSLDQMLMLAAIFICLFVNLAHSSPQIKGKTANQIKVKNKKLFWKNISSLCWKFCSEIVPKTREADKISNHRGIDEFWIFLAARNFGIGFNLIAFYDQKLRLFHAIYKN